MHSPPEPATSQSWAPHWVYSTNLESLPVVWASNSIQKPLVTPCHESCQFYYLLCFIEPIVLTRRLCYEWNKYNNSIFWVTKHFHKQWMVSCRHRRLKLYTILLSIAFLPIWQNIASSCMCYLFFFFLIVYRLHTAATSRPVYYILFSVQSSVCSKETHV